MSTASTDTVYTCIDYFCVTNEAPEGDNPQQGAHILDIDLRLADRVVSISTKARRALDKRVHARLSAIATHDKEAPVESRIDAICANDAGPTRRMWNAFKELNPRHLTLIGGRDENCYFEPLRSMSTWNRLESIRLSGICSPGCVFRLPPFVLRTLKSLDLNYCLDLDLRAVGGTPPTLHLENLDLHTNDVGVSAAMLLKNFPSVKHSLTRLSIHSTVCGYDNERERTGIRRVLKDCTKLTDVRLTLRLHHAVRIPHFLPPDVQRLEFAAERRMALLPLVNDWIACAKDPQWVPKLRVFKFTVDRDDRSMSDSFLTSDIQVDDSDSDSSENTENWMASLPPGITVTFDEPPPAKELFDESDSLSDNYENIGFDADPKALSYRRVTEPDDEVDDLDDIDLDNLPGIGPHPNHVLRTNLMMGSHTSEEDLDDPGVIHWRGQKSKGDNYEALEKFEEAFAAKKQELYKILRDSRPGIELVD